MQNPVSSPRLHNKVSKTDKQPWTGRTEAWVEEQGIWGPRVPSQETAQWVYAQQLQQALTLQEERLAKERAAKERLWEATASNINKQAERWMAKAEAARQAALREAEKTRRVQEEVRRVREKSEAREAQRRREREEARLASDVDSRAQSRQERENAAKRLVKAWNTYEHRWAALQSSHGGPLTFRTVPWPLVCTPSSVSSISDDNIAFFLLSPLHSQNKSRKERIRDAMQRWHNDKFEPRILPRVVESDRTAVKEGVDVVVRCLNNLLTRHPSS